jgi:hypothetical protein
LVLSTPTLTLPHQRGRELKLDKFQICLISFYFSLCVFASLRYVGKYFETLIF